MGRGWVPGSAALEAYLEPYGRDSHVARAPGTFHAEASPVLTGGGMGFASLDVSWTWYPRQRRCNPEYKAVRMLRAEAAADLLFDGEQLHPESGAAGRTLWQLQHVRRDLPTRCNPSRRMEMALHTLPWGGQATA